MLTLEQIKDCLCDKDPRYPDGMYNSPYYKAIGEEPPPPRVNCYCDNCFYGRDKLACALLELLEPKTGK